jgi:cell division protein FtsL
MSTVSHVSASAVVEPVVRPRPRPRPRSKPKSRKRAEARTRGGILWIAISGILLAGVVFVNVAVLQLNLSLDKTNSERSKLLADNAALQSQYSSLVASRAIKQQAVKQFGLVYQDPYGYVNLAK